MAVQVFVSHTQRDVEFCDIFDRACARVGIKAFRSEFESIKLPAWETIRDAIRHSKALFLLIGKELVRAQALHEPLWLYSQNWIAYEIGIACERTMDVWVICDDVAINFPVPYLNNYLPVSLRHTEVFNLFLEVLRIYAQGNTIAFPDPQYAIECPYPACKAIYNLPLQIQPNGTITCPQCLQPITFPEGHLL